MIFSFRGKIAFIDRILIESSRTRRNCTRGGSFERFQLQKPIFNGSKVKRKMENLGVASLCKWTSKGNAMEFVGTTHNSNFFNSLCIFPKAVTCV